MWNFLGGLFKLLSELLALARKFRKPPEAVREDVIKEIVEEAHAMKETGRPKWD